MRQTLQRAFIAVASAALLTGFVFGYNSDFPGGFATSFLVVAICCYLIFGNEAFNLMGLSASRTHVIAALLMCVVLYFPFRLFIQSSLATGGLELVPGVGWDRHIQRFFQVLNEEVVLRALILPLILLKLRNRLVTAALIGALFAALHVLLYRYLPVEAPLTRVAILNLFLFGFACNWLFLRWHHIWFSTSIHLAWNLSRFGKDFRHIGGGPVGEAWSFNVIEGRVAVSIVIALAFAVIYAGDQVQQKTRAQLPR
jgi:hypothetical protein